MKKISIIMPFLNEGSWPYETVESIYKTADPNLFKIIAINEDPSNVYNFSKYPDVKYIENKKRLGVDGSRQLGVELADTSCCLIIDAHMLFYPDSNWLNKIIDSVEREEKTCWCYVCTAIGYGTKDIYKHKGEYYAANLKLFTAKEKHISVRQIIEPIWGDKKNELEYPVQVVLGANYAFNRDYFLKLHGFRGLKSWGTSEPFISLKYWLSGGACKIKTDVRIAHFFRDSAPYITNISDLVYNKLYLMKTIFPKDLEEKLIKHIPDDINYKRAQEFMNQNEKDVEKEREYYNSIFTRDIYDFCKEFNVEIPT